MGSNPTPPPDPVPKQLRTIKANIKQSGIFGYIGRTFADPVTGAPTPVLNFDSKHPDIKAVFDNLTKPKVPAVPATRAHPAGTPEVPAGPLNYEKLREVVNVTVPTMRAGHENAYNDMLRGAAPGVIEPPFAPAAPGSLLHDAKGTLDRISVNLNGLIDRLLTTPNDVTDAEWKNACQGPLQDFKDQIQTKIDELKDEKFRPAAPPGAPPAAPIHGYPGTADGERAYNRAKQAQIRGLEALRTEFEKEVLELQNKTVFNAIQSAEFKDNRPALPGRQPLVIAPAVPPGGQPPLPIERLNDKEPHTLSDHAAIVRVKPLKDRMRVGDTSEMIDINMPLSSGDYNVVPKRFTPGILSYIRFKYKLDVGDDYIKMMDGFLCPPKEVLETMFDAYYAKFGAGPPTLTVEGKVDFSDLKTLAEVVEARRAATPPKPPTEVKLTAEVIAKLGKSGISDAQIQQLGEMLEGPAFHRPAPTR